METREFEDFINPPALLTSPFESENTNSSLDDTIDSLSTLELKEVGFTKKRLRNGLNCEQLSTNFFEMISSDLLSLENEITQMLGLSTKIEQKGNEKGKLEIFYNNLEQFNDLLKKLKS